MSKAGGVVSAWYSHQPNQLPSKVGRMKGSLPELPLSVSLVASDGCSTSSHQNCVVFVLPSNIHSRQTHSLTGTGFAPSSPSRLVQSPVSPPSVPTPKRFLSTCGLNWPPTRISAP